MCGPRGLPATQISSTTTTVTDVYGCIGEGGILKPGPRYSITSVSYDFDNDGWPDIYVAVDSEPSILFKNNHNGTFTDVAVMTGCAYNDNGHEQAGMGVGVADYDCDGWLDIFKTNFADDTGNLYHKTATAHSATCHLIPASASITAMWHGDAALLTTTMTAGQTLCK